ncbi:hypothetical protein SVAN01_10466 [Stagonosporopsis vannaccii]|nr:hypothetical protein SVAN01_10466 [Stagonosporopsis vannaccii]
MHASATIQRAIPRGVSHHAFALSLLRVAPKPVCRVTRKLTTRVARKCAPTDLPTWADQALVFSSAKLASSSSPAVEMITTTVTSNWASSSLHDPSILPQRSGHTLHQRIDSRNSRRLRCHESPSNCRCRHQNRSQPHAVTLHDIEHVHPTLHMHLAAEDLRERIKSLATFGPASYRSRCKCSRLHFWLPRKRLGQ